MDNPNKKKGNSFTSHLMWGLESGGLFTLLLEETGRFGWRFGMVICHRNHTLDPSSFVKCAPENQTPEYPRLGQTIVFKHIFKSVSEYSKNTWLQEITGRIKEAYIEFAYKGLTCTPSLQQSAVKGVNICPAYSNLHKHSIKHIWICI